MKPTPKNFGIMVFWVTLTITLAYMVSSNLLWSLLLGATLMGVFLMAFFMWREN